MAYRNAVLQRLALFVNESAKSIWRYWPGLKSKIRAIYYDVNGQGVSNPEEKDMLFLKKHFLIYNQQLAYILVKRKGNLYLPFWLQSEEL